MGSQKVYKFTESDNVVVLQGPSGFYRVQLSCGCLCRGFVRPCRV